MILTDSSLSRLFAVYLFPVFNNDLKGLQMMELPEDPMMLFSVVNMKLRDCYASLDELCEDMDIDKEELIRKLRFAGFEYSPENNKFW